MSVLDKVDGWVVEYPEIERLSEDAQEVFWLAKEVDILPDINGFLLDSTEGERHAMTLLAQIFVEQELNVANYWLTRFYKEFPRPEFRSMASYFGMTETALHAKFYSKLPEAFKLDQNPNFYSEFKLDPQFRSRMSMIGKSINHKDIAISVATFALVEYVSLFSQFAFIKSFSSNTHNRFNKFAEGINFSAIDETFHAMGGFATFRILDKEGLVSDGAKQEILEIAIQILKHEYYLINKMYEKGGIVTVDQDDLCQFADNRIIEACDEMLLDLGIPAGDCFIETWFYKDFDNKTKAHDSFSNISNTYNKKFRAGTFTYEART